MKFAYLITQEGQPTHVALTEQAALDHLKQRGFALEDPEFWDHIYVKPYPAPHEHMLQRVFLTSIELLD